jgi:hypothetical protein
MNDVRLLKGFSIVLGIAVAGAITIFSPGLVLAIALLTLIAGLFLRAFHRDDTEEPRGNTVLLVGVLLLLPPLTWFGLALAHRA